MGSDKLDGPQIGWVKSDVTEDKVYGVYVAPTEERLREHTRRGEFPIHRVSRIRSVIDPNAEE